MRNGTISGLPIKGKPPISLLNTLNSPQLPDTIADYSHRTARNPSTTKEPSTALRSNFGYQSGNNTFPNQLCRLFSRRHTTAKNTNSLQQKLEKSKLWHDKNFAFVASVKVEMRDRPKEASQVILVELEQHLDLLTWHPVHKEALANKRKVSIFGSKMFL